MPRSAPATTVCRPSAMKNVEPTSNRCGGEFDGARGVGWSRQGKPCAMAKRPRITAERQRGHARTMPSSMARQARRAGLPLHRCGRRRGRPAPSPPCAMPNGHHEQDGRDLQRDLVRGERRGADQAHQQRRRGEQAIFHQERDRDRRADDDELAHQLPSRCARDARARDISGTAGGGWRTTARPGTMPTLTIEVASPAPNRPSRGSPHSP